MSGASKGAAGHGVNVLICDCDGVLIDSEAVAADVIVRELDARWPGVDARPAVMPLLGLRIERVLAGASDAVGRTLSADDVDAIRRAVEAAAVNAPMVDGIDAALAAIDLTTACASNSYRAYVEAALARTGLARFSATGCSARIRSRGRSRRPTCIWQPHARSAWCPRNAWWSRTA